MTEKGSNKTARLLLPTDNFCIWGQQKFQNFHYICQQKPQHMDEGLKSDTEIQNNTKLQK